MVNIFIASSTCHRISEMYGTYTLQAVTAPSCESSDFLFSLTEFSAYSVHRWQYWRILYSASSRSMTSAGPAIFFTLGILSSFSSCIVLVSCSPHSTSVRNSGLNFSCWHETPMSSGWSRYVYTHPVLRSNSKFDVLKNLLILRAFSYFFIGFRCERVNMWWCCSCSIVFQIISWLP